MKVSVSFFLRNKNSESATAILCRVRFNNQHCSIVVKQSIHPNDWDARRKRPMVHRGAWSAEMKAKLDHIENTILEEFYNYTKAHDEYPIPKAFKRTIEETLYSKRRSGNNSDLENYWERYIEKLSLRRDGPNSRAISPKTKKAYENSLKKLKDFSQTTNYPLSFKAVTMDFYYAFIQYMENQDYKVNTIGKVVKHLKAVMNDALSNNLHSNKIASNRHFQAHKRSTDSIYLTEAEVEALEQIDLSHDKKLHNARILFLMLCYTGQRVQDLPKLFDQDNIYTDGRDNRKYLRFVQGKGEQPMAIPLNQKIERLLSLSPTVITSTKLNKHIKEIGKLIPDLQKEESISMVVGGQDITMTKKRYELLASHCGRRTFATLMYMSNRYPTHQIMAITGHKKESTFLNYVKATDIDRVRGMVW